MKQKAVLLIDETLQFLPWGSNKEKREKRAKELEELRNG